MNRIEFIRQLENLLQNISPAEREEALQYYNDYFNDAGVENEQNVIEALGTPAKVAETIKKDLYGGDYGDTPFQKDIADDRAVIQYENSQNSGEKDSTGNGQNNAATSGNDTLNSPFGNLGSSDSNGRQGILGNTVDQNGFGNMGNQSGFGNAGNQSGFGNIGDQNGFGSNENQSGFGNTGNQSGFGSNENQSGFGNTGNQNGFGNMGNQSSFGNTGNQSGFGSNENQSGFGNAGNQYSYGSSAYGNTGYNSGYSTPMDHRKKMSTGMIVLIVVVCVIIAPVIFSLVTGALGTLLGLIAGWFCMIIGFGIAAVVLLVIGILLAGFGVAGMFMSPIGGLGMIGGGLICAGIGILFLMLTVAMAGIATPAIFRGLGYLWHKLTGKRKHA